MLPVYFKQELHVILVTCAIQEQPAHHQQMASLENFVQLEDIVCLDRM